MKLSELKARIDSLYEVRGNRDEEVVIEVHNPGLTGGTPTVGVLNANSGFDWNSGKFIIHPAQPLVIKK